MSSQPEKCQPVICEHSDLLPPKLQRRGLVFLVNLVTMIVCDGLLPQSFSGGGLYLNGIWLLWTMELVTIKTCMVGYYGACIMGYYGTSMQVTMIVHERLLWSV